MCAKNLQKRGIFVKINEKKTTSKNFQNRKINYTNRI